MVLTASTGTQFSLEGAIESGVEPSVYTRILVRALETGEADRNCDGWVDLDELHDWLLDRVRTEAPQQTPTKSGYLEGHLFIARTPVLKPAKLDPELQSALKSPMPFVRRSAVLELKKYLHGEHPGLALAAEQALTLHRNEDDSNEVRRAAEESLAGYEAWWVTKGEVEHRAAEPTRGQEEHKHAAEQERLEKEKAEENLVRQRLEAERQAAKEAEGERKAREQALRERLLHERAARQAAREAEGDPAAAEKAKQTQPAYKSTAAERAGPIQILTLTQAYQNAEAERRAVDTEPKPAETSGDVEPDEWQLLVVVAIGLVGIIVVILAILK